MPLTCVLCHRSASTQDLCDACHHELPILSHSCPRCARELSVSLQCGDCLKHSPPFDRTYALFSYQDKVKQLILNLKFQRALVNAQILGELLAQKIRMDWYLNQVLPDTIIPVPLHRKRLTERGFNQALEIARPIARSLRIPIDWQSCQRIKHTAAQATLEAGKRSENIKHAFLIQQNFSGKHIAVLDDVITTGQTMTEFTSLLKKAGAAKIDVWCCARAIIRS